MDEPLDQILSRLSGPSAAPSPSASGGGTPPPPGVRGTPLPENAPSGPEAQLQAALAVGTPTPSASGGAVATSDPRLQTALAVGGPVPAAAPVAVSPAAVTPPNGLLPSDFPGVAGLQGIGREIAARTSGVPVLGGVVSAVGTGLGGAGESLDTSIANSAERIGRDIQAVREPDTLPPQPEGTPPSEQTPTGWAGVPRVFEDIGNALFAVPRAAQPIFDIANDVVGRPATGLLALSAMAGPRILGDVAADLGEGGFNVGRHYATGRELVREVLDPTRTQRAYQAETNRLIGDVPFVGGLADLFIGGQALNPANYLGFGALTPAVRATRGIPVLNQSLRALELADRGITKGLGAPVEGTLKALGFAGKHAPVVNKLFAESRQSKYLGEGEKLVASAEKFLRRGGTVEDLAALGKGQQPVTGILNHFGAGERADIQAVANAYRDGVAATGGKVTATTEAEFVHVLVKGLAEKYNIKPTTNPLMKVLDTAEATVKEAWLAINPGYYLQNAIGNTVVGLMAGFLPGHPSTYYKLLERLGLPVRTPSGRGLTADLLGDVSDPLAAQLGRQKGLIGRAPVIGDLAKSMSKNLGTNVEDLAHMSARVKGINEYLARETDPMVRGQLEKFAGYLNREQLGHLERVIRSGARPDEIYGLLRGEQGWWARTKDWGDLAQMWEPEVARLQGRLAQLDPAAADFAAQKDRIIADEIKGVKEKADRLMNNTWLGQAEMTRREAAQYNQMYNVLKGHDNPERALEMLYSMRAATEESIGLSANAKLQAAPHAGKAGNAARQQIFRARHEQANDLIDAASAAAELAKTHPYGTNYSDPAKDATRQAVGDLVTAIGRMRADMRKIEKAAKAAGSGVTPEMLQTYWENHHQAVLDAIDRTAAKLLSVLEPGAALRLRGPRFWEQMVSELAYGSYIARGANRGQLKAHADRMMAELKKYGAELDGVPARVANFEGTGVGLFGSPKLQREVARSAAAAVSQHNQNAFKAGVDFGDKNLFNYGMTSNLEQLLKHIAPFTTWQTRAIPLYASLLAERPGALRAYNEMQASATRAKGEEGAVPRMGETYLPVTALDGLYSRLIGRPVSVYADPFHSFLQGGSTQFANEPYLRKDQSALAQALQVGGYLGGGLSMWPWIQAGLNLTDNNGRQVSYGDLFAPSRAGRYFGLDPEQAWKRFLLQQQGLESETGDPFLDRRIRERIAQIGQEEGGLSDAEMERAMADETSPLHVRARKEAEKETNAVSLLRWLLPLGVKTVSPGSKQLAELEKSYNDLKGGDPKAQREFLSANPGLSALFQKNASDAKLEIVAGQSEFYGLGTPKQRELYDFYYNGEGHTDEWKRRYAQTHEAEMKQIRALGALRSNWKQDPANALALAYMTDRNEARDTGEAPKVDEWLKQQGIPERTWTVDTRNPLQRVSQAAAEMEGEKQVAYEQQKGELGDAYARYTAILDPVRPLLDQYDDLPEGSRERSAFLRAHRELGAAFDQQRAFRDANPIVSAYVQWAQTRRAAKQETGFDAYLAERNAGKTPPAVKSTGTAKNPSKPGAATTPAAKGGKAA